VLLFFPYYWPSFVVALYILFDGWPQTATMNYVHLTSLPSLLVGLLLGPGPAQAKQWCPPGATWNYNLMSNGVEGCETRTYIGDTVIGGRTAQRILVNTILMHYMTNTLDTTNTVFHTSQDGGVIYAWDVLSSGTWDTLYWFTAVPGDRWYPPGADGLCPGQYPLGVLQVVDTGHVVLGGWSLRHVDVAFLDGAGQQSPDSFTIIERLGSPLMVIAPGGCIVSEAGGSLRTYDDNAFPPYNSGEPSTCDQFTGIDGPVSRPAFDVYPNPAHTMATLTMRFSEDPPTFRPHGDFARP
jgi:hypothetical protein